MPLTPPGTPDASSGRSSRSQGIVNVGDMADGVESICEERVGVSDIAACAQCVGGVPHVCGSSSSSTAQSQPPQPTSASSWHSNVMRSSAATPSLKRCNNCGISSAEASAKDVCRRMPGYVVHHRFVKEPQKRGPSERKPGSSKAETTTSGTSSSSSASDGIAMLAEAASSAGQAASSAQPQAAAVDRTGSPAKASAAANALVEHFRLMHEIQGYVQKNPEAATGDIALRKQYGTFLAKLSASVEDAQALLSQCADYPARDTDIRYVDKQGGLMSKYVRDLVRLPGTVDLKSCDSAGIDLATQHARARDAWTKALAGNPTSNVEA